MDKRTFLTVITAAIAGFFMLASGNAAARSSNEDTIKMLDLLGDVFEKVREEYVEEPEDKKLIEAAINGMLTDLDPHSAYLSAEDFEEMQVQTKGEFGGLGIEVTMRNGMVYIVSPIDDTPAFDKGLQAGDYISHIDEESVIGMTIRDAVERMRGKAGTAITLTILREGEDEPFDVEIIRDIIKIKSVRSRREGDIGYIRITSFSEQTDTGLHKAIKKLKKEIGKDKLRGVVLDLRNNPGGLLNQAIAVSDTFLDRGEIVSTRGRQTDSTKRFNASSGDRIDGLPMVVLLNSGSASASEIVAGALKDHKRAVVMGTKSFGKGSVQTVIPLPQGSAMRITTSRYYTPSGVSIQAEGIEPDIEVKPATIEYLDGRSAPKESDLRGHLNATKVKEGEENKDKDGDDRRNFREGDDKKEKDDKDGENKDGDESSEKENEEEDLYVKDYQLARALDLLRGIYVFSNSDRYKHVLER